MRSRTISVGTSRLMARSSGCPSSTSSSFSACWSVRGKPSSTKPWSMSPSSANRSSTILSVRSSGTRSPRFMYSSASRPAGVPTAAAARNRSPVETCSMPYRSARRAACVPFPAPCLPSRTRRGPLLIGALRLREETLVVAHHQLAVDLLHRFERDAHGDQQRGAAERELSDIPQREHQQRRDRDRCEEQ